jgi:putative methyltransferase (TIGR04325 family)
MNGTLCDNPGLMQRVQHALSPAAQAVKPWVPPILWQTAKRLRARAGGADLSAPDSVSRISGPVEWEYVPEGWAAERRDPHIKGWSEASIRDAYLRRWPAFLKSLEGPTPLDFCPESPSPGRHDPLLHNLIMTFGYVLARAAHGKTPLKILDWGGAVGYFYLLARKLVPHVALDYHCKDLSVFVDCGRSLLPDVKFHADEDCLRDRYDLVLASAALHYSPDWQGVLSRLAAASSRYVYITCQPTVVQAPSFVFVQRPYSFGYQTEYLGWCLNRGEFLAAAASSGLTLEREFIVGHAPVIRGAPEQNQFAGFLFRRAGVAGKGPA